MCSRPPDVEVILHLYEDHGPDCVKHLRGMFAFAIWDTAGKTLFLARDHMGQKPLFFHHDDGAFLFASEAKAILASGMATPKIELNALWHYMSLRFVPDQYSLFEGISKLPAGCTLTWKDGKHRIEKYWDLSFVEKFSQGETEIEEQLNDLLADTVSMHLLSDVQVGAFLSGGIDSSLISAMMAKITQDPVPTFSIGVKEHGFNELPYARMVTERYGMDAHEEVVEADLIHMIPSMIRHMDEPSDPFGVGVYLVSGIAAKHVKVVLSGDGGDENFAGYDRFAGQRLVDYYCWMPVWLRRQVMRRLIDLVPESFGYKSIAQKLRWLHDMSFFTHGDRYARSMSVLRFTQEAKQELFTASAISGIDDIDSGEKVLTYFDSANVNELVDRMLYTDLMTRMPDHLLVTVDRMSMAHSLECRSPLVDYKVVEFAARIPSAMKLKGRSLKHILKKTASRYVPHEVIYRKKQGFSFPLSLWMRTELAGFLHRLFDDSRMVELGIFNNTNLH